MEDQPAAIHQHVAVHTVEDDHIYEDARSESSMFSFASSLNIEELPACIKEYIDRQAAGFPSFEAFQQEVCEDTHRQYDDQYDGASLFGEYLATCIQQWVTEIVQPLLNLEPLEGKLAGEALSASLSLEHAKKGQDWLAVIVRCCSTQAVLLQILNNSTQHHVQAATLASSELYSEIQSRFKKANRKQRVALKSLMAQFEHPDGLHEVADLLQRMVSDALKEAVSEIDMDYLGKMCWKTAARRMHELFDDVATASGGLVREHDHVVRSGPRKGQLPDSYVSRTGPRRHENKVMRPARFKCDLAK